MSVDTLTGHKRRNELNYVTKQVALGYIKTFMLEPLSQMYQRTVRPHGLFDRPNYMKSHFSPCNFLFISLKLT